MTIYDAMNNKISVEMQESFGRYVKHGIPTGGFLRAVLSNDLFDAMARADLENRDNLFNIVYYVAHNLPYESYGSKDIVDTWKGLVNDVSKC